MYITCTVYIHLSFLLLVTEALSAHNAREEGRLVYKYGGDPVASFLPHPTHTVLKPTVAHALFMNATHDNDPGLISQRSVYDALPNTALVAIASCASGSCAGYDQLVPHMVRHYPFLPPHLLPLPLSLSPSLTFLHVHLFTVRITRSFPSLSFFSLPPPLPLWSSDKCSE